MADDVVIEKMDIKNLEKIIRALKKGKLQGVKIGIFGDKAVRSPATPNNATIGMYHEFGTSTIPQRSFLRVPIRDHLEKRLESAKAFDEKVLAQVTKDADMLPWLKKVAIVAEGIVADGFASNGFGKWKSWSGNYTSSTGNILVDTHQLRDSISTKVG